MRKFEIRKQKSEMWRLMSSSKGFMMFRAKLGGSSPRNVTFQFWPLFTGDSALQNDGGSALPHCCSTGCGQQKKKRIFRFGCGLFRQLRCVSLRCGWKLLYLHRWHAKNRGDVVNNFNSAESRIYDDIKFSRNYRRQLLNTKRRTRGPYCGPAGPGFFGSGLRGGRVRF